MKAGHFIILGLVIWILLSFFDSIWVFKSRGHIIAVTIVGIALIAWVRKQENRKRLLVAFFSKGLDRNSAKQWVDSIQVGLITVFSLAIIFMEISKSFVQQSEGFNYIAKELGNNKTIHDQIGEIKHIAIGNSLSVGLSFKTCEKRLKTNLVVFGTSGQLTIDMEVTKTEEWQVGGMKIYN